MFRPAFYLYLLCIHMYSCIHHFFHLWWHPVLYTSSWSIHTVYFPPMCSGKVPSPWRPILGILFCSETVSLGSSRMNPIGSLMSNLEFFSLCHMFVSDIPVLCTCYGTSQIYPSRFCHPIPDFLACDQRPMRMGENHMHHIYQHFCIHALSDSELSLASKHCLYYTTAWVYKTSHYSAISAPWALVDPDIYLKRKLWYYLIEKKSSVKVPKVWGCNVCSAPWNTCLAHG